MKLQQLDGRLAGQQNIFNQRPTPAVDAAWGNLSSYNHIFISKHDLLELGIEPEVALHIPPELGLGDVYAATVDVGHKIHCLDSLRKEVYSEHYFGGDSSPPRLLHADHCLQLLLQSLICDANTDVTPFVWYEGSDSALDFIVKRKCGNFDGVFTWATDHGLSFEPLEIKRPPDQATLGRIEDELVSLLPQMYE